MKFEHVELEGKIMNFADLDEIMVAAGFDSQWDYERITYDYKIIDLVRNDTYYFRVPALVQQGEIPKDNAKVQLMHPYLGKHYYPHGVEYDEVFPENIIDKCNKKIALIVEKVKAESVN
jgi:hypothetical protein